MRLFFSLILFGSILFAFDTQLKLENTNIATSDTKKIAKNYNRLRVYTQLEDKRYDNIFIKLILDNINKYDHTIDENENEINFYRGYIKYIGEEHLFAIGLQRVPFGVGRIWNPIDIFNPIDVTSIETSEREGVKSIRYEYAISDLSNIDITYSKDKSAFRIKGFFEVADMALIVLTDKKQNKSILGYELEGEFLDSGIELRSEGGYFKDTTLDIDLYEYIIGLQYGFWNDLTTLAEYKYNTHLKRKYLAINNAYQLNKLISLNLLTIKNLEDDSYMITSSFKYNIGDDITLDVGAFNYSSSKNNELDLFDDYYFVKLFVHF